MVINNLLTNMSNTNNSNLNSNLSSINKLTKMLSNNQKPSVPNPILSLNNSSSKDSSNNKILSLEDKKINLNALKNHDPFATNILDMAVRVAVYKFLSKKNEWKKLDVEGSLFIFERMVEPLHSFVVMNTLALNLFLQPITYDLDFQDRNPFLLYKSNNDIFGIWFIDKEDCGRIKTSINGLIEKAKERRSKREQTKSNQNNKLITPLALISMTQTQTSTCSTINSVNIFNNNNNNKIDSEQKSNIDIIQMLNKAQAQFINSNSANNLSLEPTSHSTPGGLNLILNQDQNEPKPISQWLNKSNFIKPEPIRQSPTQPKPINPILQLLLPNQQSQTDQLNSINSSSSNQTLNQSQTEQDLMSLDLKRKLNILSSTNNFNLTSPIIGASPSIILTPSENLLLKPNSLTTNRPITVKDFEDNLLNQSTHSTPTCQDIESKQFEQQKVNQKQQNMFYLANDSSSNNTTNTTTNSSDYCNNNNNNNNDKKNINNINNISKSNNLSLVIKQNQQKVNSSKKLTSLNLSSSSDDEDSSSSSDDSDSDTDRSETSSPNRLPLLLTPAAFESSSASSTTSSSFNQNNNEDNIINDNKLQSFLFPTQFKFDLNLNTNSNFLNTSNVNSKNDDNVSNNNVNSVNTNNQVNLLTKTQLQQALIHLLNNDDQFLTSIHQAYLKSNKQESVTLSSSSSTATSTTTSTTHNKQLNGEMNKKNVNHSQQQYPKNIQNQKPKSQYTKTNKI